ncbi:MAG: hypothetical protein CMF62_03270 [Magnetococcales bacterium]|nr:hypothetical protein [Magnetococcales bacterium]|tara:strand:+ start:2974 stop:3411 length:438 start_codon:yes stop_codon:yes gene_type:complete
MAQITNSLYDLDELLDRIDTEKEKLNFGEKTKLKLPPPQVQRAGKKAILQNFQNICESLKRTQSEVRNFLNEELSTSSNIIADNQLSLTGNFREKNIKRVLGRYVTKYVFCPQCTSPNTIIKKENRIMYIICNSCLSKNSIDYKY